MSSCVCKILFKSVQVCGGCCKMFRRLNFLGTQCIVTVVAVSVCMSVQCLLYSPWLFWEGGYPPFLSVPFLVAFLPSVPLGSRPPPDVLWCILGTNLHHFGCWTTSWWACLCVCLSAIFGTTLPIFLCVLSIKRMFPWYICITYCPGRKKF